MDLDSLKDPQNSNCNSSTLNNNSNTSGIENTKLNEPTLIEVEQNKTEHFKIGDNNGVELSKEQVPVKQMITTTSVVNVPKLIKINLNPHYISSSLDISTNTSGKKVTKLNESISTQLQEINKTENFKIKDIHDVEISKQPKPVNQIIATTSVKNENNIHPNKISSSLNNSSSTTGKEVAQSNESISTVIQEQKKIDHFKVNDVETSLSNRKIPVKHVLPAIAFVNSSNIHFHNTHRDLNSLLDNNNKKHSIEVSKINKSTSIKVLEQKKTVNLKILDNINVEKSKQQIPIKNLIKAPLFLNTLNKNKNNVCLRPNTYPLNIEKIAVPQTVISNVKILPSVMTGQIKKPSTFSIIPSTTRINPTNTIIKRLQPKLNPVNLTNNKCISTLKPGFKIISQNDLKSKIVLNPQKNCKYVLTNIENGKVTNLPTCISKSPMLKPFNSIIPVTVAEKFNAIEEKPKIKDIKSKFVVNFKEFQNQRYRALQIVEKKIFKKYKHLFVSNTNFQLIQQSSTNSFIKKQKTKCKPHTDPSSSKEIKTDANITDSKHNQQEKEVSSLNKNKNLTDFRDISELKKHIPHTITSKDVTNNHTNVVILNNNINKTEINTNIKKEFCPTPGFIQLSSKPESLIKTYGQPLAITKYGNFTGKEQKTVRLVPLSSINQPKTKPNATVMIHGKPVPVHIMKKNNNFNSTITKIPTDQLLKMIPNKVYPAKNTKLNKFSNKPNVCYKKISLEPLIKDLLPKVTITQKILPKSSPSKMITTKHQQEIASGQFVTCEYEYCNIVASKLEMIDFKYCSKGCKRLATKLKLATEKTVVIEQPQENTDFSKKPPIDRKMLLAKLRSRINKRKQNLSSFQKEDVSGLCQAAYVPIESTIPITVNHSFQKSVNKRKYSKSIRATTTVVENGKLEKEKILSYLQHTNYIPAPKRLFDNPFPLDTNPFKVGQRLEGIDPEHEALFCVMSVVEVCGYRIKLHFDGYPDIYNFWVNANCPDLFFPRWCEQNSRILQPPKNYNRPFKWTDYLHIPGVTAAPKWNFPTALNTNRITTHSFYVGAKLEALDKLTRTTSKQLICVATIADFLGNRIRIHFDGWTDDFDYWTDITSTNIHPVGWCDKNGRSLCPPRGYDDCKGKQPFSWTKYLKETNSQPVPEDAFFRRPLREFTNSMAIEVVDIANPSLIRIAKVVDVKGDELKILYDGFDTIYAYWIEDDSPNIHPLGWCLKTNHPIELFKANAILWTCRVPGCNGKGNANSSKNTHVFSKDCPYEFESWKKLISGLTIKPDRINPEDLLSSVPSLKPVSTIITEEDNIKEKLKSNKIKRYRFRKSKKSKKSKRSKKRINNKLKKNLKKKIPNGRSKTVYKRAVEAMDELEIIKGVNDYTSYGYGSFKRPRLNVWTRHSVLRDIPIFNTTDVRKWPIKEVATFVETVVSNNYTDDNPSDRIKISKTFLNQEIDGDVFLMLTQKDLTDILNIPLGPALKLHNAIVVLRQRTSAFDVANGLL
uniref:Lethal(3)malignant brain tumor-like protein 3 n=1 Tax=Schizaphis graminum TaxID=13262 RepID=A0A2S2NZ86_SCHGA